MRIRTTTLTKVGAALLASTLFVSGCADSGDDNDNSGGSSSGGGKLTTEEIYTLGVHGDDNAGEPKKGGTLRVGEYAEARSLDPTVTIPSGAVGGSAMAAVYDVLLRYDFETKEFVPQLAESFTSEDNTVWTLKLREGVNFSDGTPVNAAAVLGSMGYYMENRGFNIVLLASNIAKMEPKDDLTIEFTLNGPWASFPNQLAAGFGMILAPAAIKGGPEKFKPIGAGPFVFDSYKPGEKLVLKRNDDYFGEKAHLDAIEFSFPASDPARLEALENGDFDQIAIRQAKAVEDARQAGHPGAMIPAGLGMIFAINNREGRPGNDVRIRKAIAMAIDPKIYQERVQEGAGVPSRNIFASSADYYSEIEELETNIEEAKKLVAEAKADGVPTTMTYIGQSDQASNTTAVTVQALLKEIGIDVKIEALNSITDQTNRLYVTHDYDIATSSWSLPVEDPYAGLANNLTSTSPMNALGYANPEMDKLVDALKNATGEERTAAAKAINELWQEENPAIAISPGAFFFPWGKNVHGIVPTSENLLLYGNAWIG